jgi:hypothetical protein
MQLAFSNIVVGPYFDAISEIFPMFENVSHIVLSNVLQLTSLLPDNKPVSPSPPEAEANIRRMSMASGTIELPPHLVNFIYNGEEQKSKMAISSGIRRLSLGNCKKTVVGNFGTHQRDTNQNGKTDIIDERNEESEESKSDESMYSNENIKPVFEKLK